MSWVAVERAIRIAHQRGLPADLSRWMAVRDSIYNQLIEHGWRPAHRAFVQHYDTDQEIRAATGLTAAQARALSRDMVVASLLIEHSRYRDGAYVDVLVLPYQRFSDHLVARHLLDAHLDVSDEPRLRHCFHANRPLGAIFILDGWGQQYAEPGLAAALMLEFPERVKRLAARNGCSMELIAYLPKARRLLRPFVDAFLDGLYWRGAAALGADAWGVVLRFLERQIADLTVKVYEVLCGLAARPHHPWDATWLWNHLRAHTMPDRDLSWSEYLRSAHENSNLRRLLAWVERVEPREIDAAALDNQLRLLILTLTTTDRMARNRATRALVRLGEARRAHSSTLSLSRCPSTTRTSRNVPSLPRMGCACVVGPLTNRSPTLSMHSSSTLTSF